MNLVARTLPASFDVLLIVALDVSESLGIDIRSDLRNFVSQGLKVGVISLAQGHRPKRYRNGPLVQAAFELAVPILGYKDACQTQLAIVYHPELFIQRELRGNFAAQCVWMVVEEGQSESLCVADLERRAAAYCSATPILMAVNASEQQLLMAEADVLDNVSLWNFHGADEKKTDDPRLLADWSSERKVGVPTPLVFRRDIIGEIRSLAEHLASEGDYHLCARASVPTQLQTGRDEPDLLLGFPFVPKDRDQFLSSLYMYVVLPIMQSASWREDVYACFRLGVPVGLPQAFQPYFGPAAAYFEAEPTELFTEAVAPAGPAQLPDLEYARHLYRSRTHAESRSALSAAGVELNTAVEPSSVHANSADNDPASGTAALRATGAGKARVCFVTSNGAGMGHLTRLLAVARRLDDDIEASFVSMSQACGVVSQYGYSFEYIPSSGDLKAEGAEWNRYFNTRFMESLRRMDPDLVVFDGTWPYQGVAQALASYEAKFVWMRRGMWRAETATTSLVRHTGFDAVIEPGDVASSYDGGPTSRAVDSLKVDPIIVLDAAEICDQEQARRFFGLESDERAMLITLGAGNINRIDDDVKEVITAVKALPEKWRIFMTSPLIADNVDVAEGVENISVYPLARYAKAFDFVVSATGYNSFHEWIAYSVPTLWIANSNTITDDQIGRARYAHDAGLGLSAGRGGSLSVSDAVSQLGQEAVRQRIRAMMDRASFDNGASAAAEHISKLAKDGLAL